MRRRAEELAAEQNEKTVRTTSNRSTFFETVGEPEAPPARQNPELL